eukprot:966233-Pyramimonas_sp.AAC.1
MLCLLQGVSTVQAVCGAEEGRGPCRAPRPPRQPHQEGGQWRGAGEEYTRESAQIGSQGGKGNMPICLERDSVAGRTKGYSRSGRGAHPTAERECAPTEPRRRVQTPTP